MNPYELARAALEKKQLNAADRGFSAILKKAPGHWQAMRDLGVVRLHQRRFADAEKLLRRALEIRPTDTDARLQLAEMLAALKRTEEAVACYEETLTVDVACEPAWVGLHRVFDGLGRGDEALERLTQAADAHPETFALQTCVGDMLARLDRHGDALRFFVRALAIKRNDLVTLVKYATALYFADRYEEAVTTYDLALAISPSDAFCQSQKGNALFKLGRYTESVSILALALESKPGNYDALVGMGAALWRLGRNEEALSFLQAALGVNPQGTAAFNNLAHVMAALKADADAIVLFDRVHELDPESPLDARLTAATCRLRLGDYAEGWRGYETRFSVDRHPIVPPEKYAGAKRWNGEDLKGATLLVTAEQGIGDTVQFSRYMPMLARSINGRVVFAVQAAVQPLLAPSVAEWAPAGNLTLASHLGELPHCDFHIPLMSLPLIFGTRVETIPSARKYLSVPRSYREKWRGALPANGKLRVGVAWSGNTKHVNDHNRSMPIAHLAPLLGDASVDWCVIQPGLSPFDQLSLASVPHVYNGGKHLTDFADTAALIELLDVVLSVDTSVAHIAGALGKPAWLMLPWAAEWRWLHDRTDSPWYPTARLFRQSALGDWEGLVDNVQQALIEFARNKAASELSSTPRLELAM
jgi:tetratricopeptide (TPR) repeat protein